MIDQVTMYRVLCDGEGCGASAQDDGDYFAWADADQAREDAERGDWREIDGKDYCPEHWAWDDEAVWEPRPCAGRKQAPPIGGTGASERIEKDD